MENNSENQDIILINEIIKENKPVIKKQKKIRDIKTTKICKICKIEKPLNEMVINETFGLDRPVRMKNKCLECYKKVSKDYYRDNKKKVLEFHKKIYDNNRKKYSVILKFNNIDDLTNEYNKLKQKLENNQMIEVKKRTHKKKSDNNTNDHNNNNDNN